MISKFYWMVIAVIVCGRLEARDNVWSEEEETSEYWNNVAQEEIKSALILENLNKLAAKNIILFLGDGMGMPTVTAGRILKGQMHNQTGEEYKLAMEKFPFAALSRTYSVDRQTSDSATTATAYLCGVKSKYGTIGLSGGVTRENCASSKDKDVISILVDAYNAGKSTGIVTTAHITHASPAGTYAHTPERNWYSDARLTNEAKTNGCRDIAEQFYDSSDMITVALGGGRKYFRPKSVNDEEYTGETGERLDGNDYIQMWKDNADAAGEKREYVWDKIGLGKVDPVDTDRLLGLFEPESMQFEVDRDEQKEPSLAELVEKAIRMLRKNEEGYFLFVEGGRIDHGHHDGSAIEALVDMMAFDDAIDKALDLTSDSDTLIVVTADHSHTMSFGGYTYRGSSVFDIAPGRNYFSPAADGKPYTSILYGNGPGYQGNQTVESRIRRENLLNVDTFARDYLQQNSVPQKSESHGGEDVPIYASGPMAHLFHGVHEQSYIPYVMRYAACIGSNTEHCKRNEGDATEGTETETEKPPPDEEYYVTFIALDLTVTDAIVALYVQFVTILSLTTILIILGILVVRKRNEPTKDAQSGNPFKILSEKL